MASKVWRKALLVAVVGMALSLAGCGGGGGQTSLTVTSRSADTPQNSQLTASLDTFVSNTLQQADIVNAGLLLEVPGRNYRYLRAAGVANPQTGAVMLANTPFRVASVSKLLTATIVLQLVEEGYFTLDTPLSRLLDNTLLPSSYVLDDVQVAGGFKAGGSVTIRQLLQHTAGMRDYIADTPTVQDGNGLFAQMISDVLDNGGRGIAARKWDGKGLLAFYLESGLGRNALASPGQRFDYSDTHYLLLGLVIERVTGQTLTSNYRARIFNRLGMVNSWHEGFEPARGQIAHHFYHLAAQGNDRNLDIAATTLNTSAAWASGAVVSTLEDLSLFQRGLMKGSLFRERATLTQMQQVTATSPYYGLGLQRAVFNGQELWGHAGFWGTILLYAPAKDAYLVMTVNQASRDMFKEAEKVFAAALSAGL